MKKKYAIEPSKVKAAIEEATRGLPEKGKAILKLRMFNNIMRLFDEEVKDLEHFKAYTCGLWAIDQNPQCREIEWIRENAFQIEYKPFKK